LWVSTINVILTSQIISFIICSISLIKHLSDVMLSWKLLSTNQLQTKPETMVLI